MTREEDRIEFCRQLKAGDLVGLRGQWTTVSAHRVVRVDKDHIVIRHLRNGRLVQRATINANTPYSVLPGDGMARYREALCRPPEDACPPIA